MPIAPLARLAPALRLDVRPLGRLHADGRLEWDVGVLAPPGRCRLVLWRPGEEPAFRAVAGVLGSRGAGFEPPGAEGWVVLVDAP